MAASLIVASSNFRVLANSGTNSGTKRRKGHLQKEEERGRARYEGISSSCVH
jgi:hypothetical protein